VERGDKKAIWWRLYDRGAGLPCPVCDKSHWHIGFGELGNLHIILQGATPHGEPVVAAGSQAVMPVQPIVCANCGFVRLHSFQVLEENEPAE